MTQTCEKPVVCHATEFLPRRGNRTDCTEKPPALLSHFLVFWFFLVVVATSSAAWPTYADDPAAAECSLDAWRQLESDYLNALAAGDYAALRALKTRKENLKKGCAEQDATASQTQGTAASPTVGPGVPTGNTPDARARQEWQARQELIARLARERAAMNEANQGSAAALWQNFWESVRNLVTPTPVEPLREPSFEELVAKGDPIATRLQELQNEVGDGVPTQVQLNEIRNLSRQVQGEHASSGTRLVRTQVDAATLARAGGVVSQLGAAAGQAAAEAVLIAHGVDPVTARLAVGAVYEGLQHIDEGFTGVVVYGGIGAASNVVGGAVGDKVKGGLGAAANTVRGGIIQGAAGGAAGGAVSATGGAIAQGRAPTAGEVLTGAAIGGTAGGVVGGIAGALGGTVGDEIGRAVDGPGPIVDAPGGPATAAVDGPAAIVDAPGGPATAAVDGPATIVDAPGGPATAVDGPGSITDAPGGSTTPTAEGPGSIVDAPDGRPASGTQPPDSVATTADAEASPLGAVEPTSSPEGGRDVTLCAKCPTDGSPSTPGEPGSTVDAPASGVDSPDGTTRASAEATGAPGPDVPEVATLQTQTDRFSDDFAITGTHPDDPKVRVRVEKKNGTYTATDIFRGNQPKGSGGELLAQILRKAGFKRGKPLHIGPIENPPTRAVFEASGDPAGSVLGRTARNALDSMGISPKDYSFEIIRGKLIMIVTTE